MPETKKKTTKKKATAKTTAAGRPRISTPGHGGPGRGGGKPKGLKAEDYADLAAARAKREHYRAEMAKLEYEAQIKTLIPAEQVAATWSEALQMLRGRLLAVPSEVAPKILGEKSIKKIEDEIKAGLHEAMKHLSEVR